MTMINDDYESAITKYRSELIELCANPAVSNEMFVGRAQELYNEYRAAFANNEHAVYRDKFYMFHADRGNDIRARYILDNQLVSGTEFTNAYFLAIDEVHRSIQDITTRSEAGLLVSSVLTADERKALDEYYRIGE